MDGQRLPTGHVQPGQAEVALRIRSGEGKIRRLQPVDAVVGEQDAGSQLPGDDDDVEPLAPLLGEELQQRFRGRQARQLKAVQHQIGLLVALQIFQRIRQLGQHVAVGQADGGQLVGAFSVGLTDQGTDGAPGGGGLPGQEGMPQDRGRFGGILLKKTAQGGAFAKAGRRVDDRQRVLPQVAQFFLDSGGEIEDGRIDLPLPSHRAALLSFKIWAFNMAYYIVPGSLMQMLSSKKERSGGERPLVSPPRRAAGGWVFCPSAPQEAERQHQQDGQQSNPAPVQGGEEKGKPPLAGPEEGGQDARKQEKSPAAEKQAPAAAGVRQLFFAEQHGGQGDQQHHGCQLPPRDG